MSETHVTVGFKIPASEKLEIERVTKKLGINTSEYLRGIINKDNAKLNYLSDYPKDFLFREEDRLSIENIIKKLPLKYHSYTIPELVIAALSLSSEQEKRWIDMKLSQFIKPKNK